MKPQPGMGIKSTWHPSRVHIKRQKLSAIGLKSQHTPSFLCESYDCQATHRSIMATDSAVFSNVRPQKQSTWFLPREHGATAMLFTPIRSEERRVGKDRR